MTQPAQIMLKSGEVFHGNASRPFSPTFGEIVFNTGMTGYVETLTDPSYAGQILVFTYPLIGNYGVSDQPTWESLKMHVQGVVMTELTSFHSHPESIFTLQTWLENQDIPFVTGVDTRALTKCIRTKGVVPAALVCDPQLPLDFPEIDETKWIKEVSVSTPQYEGEGEKLIIVVDCGIKQNILTCLKHYPVRIKRVPYDYDYTHEAFDGILISNGPGDPAQYVETITILSKALKQNKPTFGICLGSQLMALAVGAKTYKLIFGHRSQNQPCLHVSSNRCYLTSQNHSYAVDESTLPRDWIVSFRNMNDQSVAGIEHKDLPFFSVQFHPEAAPGPEDAQWLFQTFYNLL